MGIVRKGILKGVTGRIGQVTVYNKGSETYVAESTRTGTDSKTPAQVNRRVLMANVVSQYRANKSWIQKGFQHKALRQSDYNAFCAANLPNAVVALTKQQAAAGACVLTPDYVTIGNLPPVLYRPTSSSGTAPYVTNIRMDGQRYTYTDPISSYSRSMLAMNPWLHEGDQISFIGYRQIISPFDSFPYVECTSMSLVLDTNNTAPIGELCMAFDFGYSSQSGLEYLSVDPSERFDGFAIVLSRRVRGQLAVSTARCFVIHDSVLQQYNTAEQTALAVASYGTTDPVFLDTWPDSEEVAGTTDAMFYAASRGESSTAAAVNSPLVPFSSISGLYLNALLVNGFYVRFASSQALPITAVSIYSFGTLLTQSTSCTKKTGSDREYIVGFPQVTPVPELLVTKIVFYNNSNVVQEVSIAIGGTSLS